MSRDPVPPPRISSADLHEEADQARALLAETGLDCWLTLARDTELHPDPDIEQVVGANVVGTSAFLSSATGGPGRCAGSWVRVARKLEDRPRENSAPASSSIMR